MIPMPQVMPDREKLSYVIGSDTIVNAMPYLPARVPFDDLVLDFLQALSEQLLRDTARYPDVATFAFWCRRAALEKEKAAYGNRGIRLGRGVIFHSTPSNVPVNFAFSFVAGLLAGNANIIRLPAKAFPQVECICKVIAALLRDTFREFVPYVCMVRYAGSPLLNDWFSAHCDVRIVWGGDDTVTRIRRSPLPPRSTEIPFADRVSFLVIQADAYLKTPDKRALALHFYNDTFLSDQNACTSPFLVVWLGNQKAQARNIFWHEAREAAALYALTPVQTVGKLDSLCMVAAQRHACLEPEQDWLITRVLVDELDAGLLDLKYHSGFFFEYEAERLEAILPLCTRRCQTITYWGLDKTELENFVTRCRPAGVDRIVPMGHSMDFSLVWDGIDLIDALSRAVTVS